MDLSIIERIKACYPRLGASSRQLADYIINNSTNAASKTITEVSRESGVSTATLSRFARTLGYETFSQLRWALSSEINSQAKSVEDISAEDSPKTVAKKTLTANIATLTETFALINEHDLEQAKEYIVHSRKIAFYGLGGSNIVALDAYHKLMRMPLNVIYNIEYHMALMQTTSMGPKDCAIVISHTGNDTDTLDLAKSLQNNKVPIIVVTSFANSPLTEYGDVVFYSISKDSKTHFEALESLTSQLAINDCLYAMAAQYFGKLGDENRDRIRKVISMKHQV
ncbi:MurR/RpiR family transcriptional regulator [Bifidobacterium sp. ESL0775]|uniref:MurR/RpiR family transcriptional regulator n=1 Tax=Bifidobacterium sp. ESL0775 TaxID=2983230 RepID=UPI0023F7C0ED|nr:MurR/RpiR family transcriptional regulator [Bifidobacterium sp. ESL0775]WEV68765.1 MurR/RpiR family transcriptional regulator [Bifidobacterium sp. ESL0775]